MKKGLIILTVLCLVIVGFSGCTTLEPIEYSYGQENAETASVSFESGNPGVWLKYYGQDALPEAQEGTYWNPIALPANEELQLTVHAKYEQNTSASAGGSLLGALVTSVATSAISASRTVDAAVEFTCPALEAGGVYTLVFEKGIGTPGKNTLKLKDDTTNKVVFTYEFEF